MLVPRTREQALGQIQQEVKKEQASSLGRVAARLEAFLAELVEVEKVLGGLTGPARAPLLHQHAVLRQEAQTFRWYLQVQREALGIHRGQDNLSETYPIPRAITE